jgi:hypothetical protein
VTEAQLGMVCPQCGSAAAVHSVQELGDWASMQLAQIQQGNPGQPGFPGQPQQGGVPGYAAEPGQIDWQSGNNRGSYSGPGTDNSSIGDDIAGIALDAATRFIGRAIGRRVQRAYDRAMPVLAARQETVLRNQIEIAQRHPDLRACMTDQVIFLAGGSRVLPMRNLTLITPEQADAMVATLRSG